MLNKIDCYIRQNKLLCKDKLYIVALSGGADSVALSLIMKKLGYNICAAHCNFHLRGKESNRDEDFVKEFCKKTNIELHLAHFDTKSYAELHKISIEMAARDLRYNYFEQLRKDIGADGICVAHHKNDNVETIIMNLLRGTGIHGMTGIKPKRDNIIRPLLNISREEIEKWLKEIGQDFVIDSTNLVNDVTRNKIRNELIPLLESIFPNAIENILTTQQQLFEAEKIYNNSIKNSLEKLLKNDGTTIDIKDLQSTTSPQCILFEWLKSYGFSSATIKQIAERLNAASGKQWETELYTLVIDHNSLVLIEKDNVSLKPFIIPEEGTYVLSNGAKVSLSKSCIIEISRNNNVATLDADNVTFPLTIRRVQNGDRFNPFGMQGSKLISDYLTDTKVPFKEKKNQMVVTDSNGSIIWLIGKRIANQCAIKKDTKTMITMTIKKE